MNRAKNAPLVWSCYKRPNGEPVKDPRPHTWCRRTGDQPKTWATTIKADLEPLSAPRVFGYERRRKDWVKVSSELAQDRRAWGASVRAVVVVVVV